VGYGLEAKVLSALCGNFSVLFIALRAGWFILFSFFFSFCGAVIGFYLLYFLLG
jgi:hypothetical protein